MRKIILAALALMLTAPAVQAADRLGIVLMHGKQGNPDRHISGIASALASDGYLVATPEMCWSKRRIYDKPYDACLAELDTAVADLRAKGATAIVMAGHSLGGNGALGYAANHDVKGVLLLAPAHNPERVIRRPEIAASLEKAKALVAEGRGAETATFDEINMGRTFSVSCSAETYVSFFDPAGAAVIPLSIARQHAPVLWVTGDRDKTQQDVAATLAKAPADPLNRLVTVSADHIDTPDAAIAAARDWLKGVAER